MRQRRGDGEDARPARLSCSGPDEGREGAAPGADGQGAVDLGARPAEVVAHRL